MKKIMITTLTGLALAGNLHSQNYPKPPQFEYPSSNSGGSSLEYWSRNGNYREGNNVLGTRWESPLYFTTGNSFSFNSLPTYLRMKLNPVMSDNNQYDINGYSFSQGVNTTGYLLLGDNGNIFSDQSSQTTLYEKFGAYSLLHLNGDRKESEHVQEQGYRPWMKVGITFTSNNDLAYIGHRRMGTGKDVTDLVIGWSNDKNNDNSPLGGDNLVFTFLEGSGKGEKPVDPTDNGTEIARFTPTCASCPGNRGAFGIGDYSPGNGLGPETPDYVGATLDVNGDARIRVVSQDNTLTQILVRDPNDHGRIHWRDASTLTGGGGGNFGNACGATANPLTAHHELPLGGFNFRFSDPGILVEGFNQVTVGRNGCAPPFSPGKFNVFSDQKLVVGEHSIGLYVEENNQASNSNNQARTSAGYLKVVQHNVTNDGVYAYAGDAITNYGGRFESSKPYINGQPPYNERNYGVVGYASNGAQTIGVEGTAQDAGNPLTDKVMGGNFEALGGSQSCYGVRATSATNGIDAFGGFFEGVGNDQGSYGIYATAAGSATAVWAGYFSGNTYTTGSYLPSDTRLKQDVKDLPSADVLAKLSPKTYTYKAEAYPQMNLPKGEQYGFIAQEVEAVLPQAVKTAMQPAVVNEKGETVSEAVEFKAINYQALIPLLVKGLQEQSKKIAQLEERLNACCAVSKTPETSEMPAGAVIQTRLQNADEPSLGQNIPNPFETSTRIPVYLPQNTGKAELLFYGNDGRVLQTVQISERGNVQVDVNSEALASGIYSYTLFTDGKPVATRKMVKR